MFYIVLKTLITTILIVAISEISKRSSILGAILASIPLVSVLAMMWLYIDTQDIQKVGALSINIFFLILPSIPLFLIFPYLLKQQINFYLSLGIGIAITAGFYFLMILILRRFGIEL